MLISTILEDGLRIWWGIAFPIVLLVTLCHAIVFGLPCVLFLMRREDLRLRSLALAGFLIGALPSAFIALLWNTNVVLGDAFHTLIAVSEMGFFGMSGGIAFYFVWRQQRRN